MKITRRQIFLKSLLQVMLLFLILLAMVSCQTKPESGSISGMVYLVNDTSDPGNDPQDNHGVEIALYHPVELDSTLSRINSEYPQIGIQISQETEFDHRAAELVKLTSSDALGNFSFDKVDPGTYNIVFLKDDWGIRYSYGVEVIADEVFDLGATEMFPAGNFSGSVTENQVLKSGHSYFIQGITNFIGNVEIEPQAQIFGEPGSIIRFYGNVVTPGNQTTGNNWRLVSSESMYSTEQTEIAIGSYISAVEIHGENLQICNGIFSHVSNSVALIANDSNISNSMFRYCGGGISIPQGKANLTNLIITDGLNYGISIVTNSTELSQISDCIIGRTSDGINLHVSGSYNITNSYFFLNNNAIRPDNCVGSISHNAFENNSNDIFQRFVYSPTQIQFNNFYRSHEIGVWPHMRADIANNNFFNTDGYYIVIRGPNPPEYSIVRQDLIATHNYWGLPNYEDYLLDGNDNAYYPDQPCPYYIISIPRLNSPVSDAGIQ
jgi:hypothetical protein